MATKTNKIKWDHAQIVVPTNQNITEALQPFGHDGWEAFAVFPVGEAIIVYMKRQVKDEPVSNAA